MLSFQFHTISNKKMPGVRTCEVEALLAPLNLEYRNGIW